MYNIYIYCNPKCGSSTLKKTLDNYNYNVYYTHGLEYENYVKKNFSFSRENNILENIDKSCKESKKYNVPIVIIDSYRTPIEQMISIFFNNIVFYVTNFRFDMPIYKIIEYFNINFENIYNIIKKQSMDEVLDYYKINKNIKFDFNKGYQIWCHNNKIFVKLLFKNINRWNNHLSNILKKDIKIINDNVSDNKIYNKIYNEFKRDFKIKRSNYNKLINLESFDIYNSNEDKIEYYNKWKNKIIND